MNKQIEIGKYRHFKGGDYEVIALAKHSETLAPMVVYRSLEDSGFWVRPAEMWDEIVVFEGNEVVRFKKID